MIRESEQHFFKRIIDRRKPARSLIWTIGLLAMVLFVIYYLSKVAQAG